jgi:hypothetical protein
MAIHETRSPHPTDVDSAAALVKVKEMATETPLAMAETVVADLERKRGAGARP